MYIYYKKKKKKQRPTRKVDIIAGNIILFQVSNVFILVIYIYKKKYIYIYIKHIYIYIYILLCEKIERVTVMKLSVQLLNNLVKIYYMGSGL